MMIIISPFIPFVAEEIYTNLIGKESVNLENWPIINPKSKVQNPKLEEEMNLARKVVEAGQAERKILGVKIRMPLVNMKLKIESIINIKLISKEVWDVVLKELNVKNLTVNNNFHYPKKEVEVTEAQLEKEGKLRELIRQIQSERKLKGLKPDDFINLTVPKEFEKEKDWIAKRVLAKKISLADKVVIQ